MAGDEFGEHFASLERCPPQMDLVEVSPELLPGHHRIDLLGITQRVAADLVVIALHGDLAKVPPLSIRQLKTIDNDGFFDAHPVIAVLQRRDDELHLAYVGGVFKDQWLNLEDGT